MVADESSRAILQYRNMNLGYEKVRCQAPPRRCHISVSSVFDERSPLPPAPDASRSLFSTLRLHHSLARVLHVSPSSWPSLTSSCASIVSLLRSIRHRRRSLKLLVLAASDEVGLSLSLRWEASAATVEAEVGKLRKQGRKEGHGNGI